MKWGVIKYNVLKFSGVYKSVLMLQEYGISVEDTLDRALDLYKLRHPRQQAFVFVHYLRLLKNVSCWANFVSSAATPAQPMQSPVGMPKQKKAIPLHPLLVKQRQGLSCLERMLRMWQGTLSKTSQLSLEVEISNLGESLPTIGKGCGHLGASESNGRFSRNQYAEGLSLPKLGHPFSIHHAQRARAIRISMGVSHIASRKGAQQTMS